jgi:GDPmannose 4,6-dehydratase
MKKALITGITGQDGSYLTELLLQSDYEIHGIVRRSSSVKRERLDHLWAMERGDSKYGLGANPRLHLHYGDQGDSSSLINLVYEIQPEEIYNLGAQSHVGISFSIPEYTLDVTGTGTVRLLEAIRKAGLAKKTRFYQASSSEMYGKVQEVPQTEKTPFWPRSPYACAKVASYWLTVNYREAYNLHASNGILFNHESPRRGENFVTRKITLGAARIKMGLQQKLSLGNLHAKRDWGFAGDYVKAMHLMLQQEHPGDYVIATGETHSVQEFLEVVFGYLNLDWRAHVVHDPAFDRPSEVDLLIGDYSKAKSVLNWEPQYRMKELAIMMIENDLKVAEKEALIGKHYGN